jgi:beta-glucosidase
VLGYFPPGKKDLRLLGKVYTNLIKAHSKAYRIIHQIQPTARVGIAINYRSLKPAELWNPLDRIMVYLNSSVFNNPVPKALKSGVLRLPWSQTRLPEAKGTQDYLGLNYYTREYIAFSLLKPDYAFMRTSFREEAEVSTTGFIANEPEGMFEALKWALQFQVPIIVTENGIEDKEDLVRSSYIIQHLHQIWRGVNFNWPIKGYFYWTLVDNFEWERGWTQRFGLWELDIETQARRKRPSADLYAEICQQNSITADMVRKYAPHIFEQIFPGGSS